MFAFAVTLSITFFPHPHYIVNCYKCQVQIKKVFHFYFFFALNCFFLNYLYSSNMKSLVCNNKGFIQPRINKYFRVYRLCMANLDRDMVPRVVQINPNFVLWDMFLCDIFLCHYYTSNFQNYLNKSQNYLNKTLNYLSCKNSPGNTRWRGNRTICRCRCG